MPLRLYLVSLGLEVQNISYYIFNQSWQLHGRLDKNSLMVNINCHFLEADLSQWAACPSMMRHWWRKPRKPIRGSHEPTRASPSSLAKCSSAQWHRKLDLHTAHSDCERTLPAFRKQWRVRREMQCHCSSLLTDACVFAFLSQFDLHSSLLLHLSSSPLIPLPSLSFPIFLPPYLCLSHPPLSFLPSDLTPQCHLPRSLSGSLSSSKAKRRLRCHRVSRRVKVNRQAA